MTINELIEQIDLLRKDGFNPDAELTIVDRSAGRIYPVTEVLPVYGNRALDEGPSQLQFEIKK